MALLKPLTGTALCLSVLGGVLLGADSRAAPTTYPALNQLSVQIDEAATQLRNAEDNLRVVEVQYSEIPEPPEAVARARRFSQGETQYLLGQYSTAAVLFYDLLSDKRFAEGPQYEKALSYLAECLYQQQNFTGARWYLFKLLKTPGAPRNEVLTRFIEISIRLNEFSEVEDFIPAVKNQDGTLPPDIAYVYGRWLFKRTDLTPQERIRRAFEVFEPLSMDGASAFRLQAAYFMGVGHIQLRDFPSALKQFERVVQSSANDDTERDIRNLAMLSMARVQYEMGDFDGAIARYQSVPRESVHFADAMYEVAWAYIRKGDFKKALNSAEVLKLVAQGTTLEPSVALLQGHLQQKLGRYSEATGTYRTLVDNYAPVRDEIESMLGAHSNPVAYFDELLAKNNNILDITTLLPPAALQWATTEEEVRDAVEVVKDLEVGNKAVGDSEILASDLLQTLDTRGPETFPGLQEGLTRTSAVESAMTRIEQAIVLVERTLFEDKLQGEEKAKLAQLKAEQESLQARFDTLPRTLEQVEERRYRMHSKVMEVDQAAFKLEYELQTLFAVATAVEKWMKTTRASRSGRPEEEQAFLERLESEVLVLTALRNDVEQLRRGLQEEKAAADAALTGEGLLRERFADILRQQRALIQNVESRLPPDAAQIKARADQLRDRASKLQARASQAKAKLQDRVARNGQRIRDAVQAEQKLLKQYLNETAVITSGARQLVGKIVVNSFERVRKQFHDLVLKADVGIVDVAFTRKQDKTAEIQKLANQKDREMQALDSDFKEVLEDVK